MVSNTGQNLCQPFATPGAATVADGRLRTPPTAGTTTGVTGAAYTNNDLDPVRATTLYDLATATNQVVIQSPANAGTPCTDRHDLLEDADETLAGLLAAVYDPGEPE